MPGSRRSSSDDVGLTLGHPLHRLLAACRRRDVEVHPLEL